MTDEPSLPTPVSTETTAPVPEATLPPQPVAAPPGPNKSLVTLLIVACIIALSLFISVLVKPAGRRPQPAAPTPTPTLAPTPTPQRIGSALATTSAFMQVDLAVASLSAQVNATRLDDPSLVPPVLDLPLGFSN